MPVFPDRNETPTKEEVLSRAPYLRTYLDRTAEILNPEKWQNDLKLHDAAIDKELESYFGVKWKKTTLGPLVSLSRGMGIFSPTMSDTRLQLNATERLVKFGYELENAEETKVVFGDIVERFRDESIFNRLISTTDQGKKRIIDLCSGILSAGIYLKRISIISAWDTKDSTTSYQVRRFIEGLDLSDLNL